MIVSGNIRRQSRGQSALRHRVRNLRAKVRLLLPMEVCSRSNKRGKNLLKMIHNRMSLQPSSRRWGLGGSQREDLYVAPECGRTQKHLFYRLTGGEIEQIKEDKLYYVGQEFLEEFDRFVQGKEKEGKGKGKYAKATVESIPCFSHKTSNNFHKTTSSYWQGSVEKQGQNVDRMVREMVRLQAIQKRRRMIRDEELSRRAVMRAKIHQRERQRQLNYSKAMAKKEESVRERNHLKEVQSSMSIRLKDGRELEEMTEFSEKLRGLCLHRSVKTWKLRG